VFTILLRSTFSEGRPRRVQSESLKDLPVGRRAARWARVDDYGSENAITSRKAKVDSG